ncbi:MAG: hypothetical protein KDI71_22130 [Xanthomonadales bacterium]|nr:hypothetical protein [Xanthomonadales bacterium]
MSSEFPVRVGRLIKWVSALSCVLLFGMAALFGFGLTQVDFRWLSYPLLALPLVCLLFIVRGYRIDGSTLYVRRLLHETTIDLRDLRSAEVLPRVFDRALRIFGNGGLFSFSGWFWRRGQGLLAAYAMDVGAGVQLRWDDRCVVLTPVDPQGMVASLQAHLGRPRSG